MKLATFSSSSISRIRIANHSTLFPNPYTRICLPNDCSRIHPKSNEPFVILRYDGSAFHTKQNMIQTIALILSLHAPQPITLNVDAREAGRGLFHVREQIPVASGKLRLWYP